MRAIERDDTARVQEIAPFLSALPAGQRDAVIGSLRPLAGAQLQMKVSRGSAETWLLQVSRAGSVAVVVPFRRGDGGRWQMSPMLEQTLHIDVVPARK